MTPIWMQVWFCVPLWIVATLCVALIKAQTSATPLKRALWLRWAIVFGFFLVTSLLWANPSQMLYHSGPFAGRVIDADTGEAVPVALLAYHWQGALGQRSTHDAWTLTRKDGSYRLGWQGFGNWRIGAAPGPDYVYVEAPGYGTTQFFLDGVRRNPNGDIDDNAKSATMANGTVRLQRLRQNSKINAIRYGIPFGVRDRHDLLSVARQFYLELFPRLCVKGEREPEWEPTNQAFSQLYSIVHIIDPARIQSTEPDGRLLYFDSSSAPIAFDESTIIELCEKLDLQQANN